MSKRQSEELESSGGHELMDAVRQVVSEHKKTAVAAGVGAAIGAALLGPLGAAGGGALGGFVGEMLGKLREDA